MQVIRRVETIHITISVFLMNLSIHINEVINLPSQKHILLVVCLLVVVHLHSCGLFKAGCLELLGQANLTHKGFELNA